MRELVGYLTEWLRGLARELDCSILLLSSQNRASGYGQNNGGNALASAKESGDIEYTADVVLAIANDDRAPVAPHLKARVLTIEKNRQGPKPEFGIRMDWRGDRQMWTEAAR